MRTVLGESTISLIPCQRMLELPESLPALVLLWDTTMADSKATLNILVAVNTVSSPQLNAHAHQTYMSETSTA
jgi:hypothetical protein